MLTLQKNQRTGRTRSEAALEEFAKGIFAFANRVKESFMETGSKRKPIEYLTKLGLLNNKGTVCFLKLTYERNEREFSILIPLTTHLLDAIKYEQDTAISKEQAQSDEITSESRSLMYHPYVMFAAGFISALNLFSIISRFRLLLPRLFQAIPFYGNIISLSFATLYFAPIIGARIRKELLKRLDDVASDIGNNKYEIAVSKLHNMPMVYKFILEGGLPFAKDLKWSFYYLCGLLGKRGYSYSFYLCAYSCFEQAHIFATTPEERYLCINELINLEEHSLLREEARLEKFFDEETSHFVDGTRTICVKNIEYLKRMITSYLQQLPNCPKLHREKCEKFVNCLRECIQNLSSIDTIDVGIQQLEALKPEGYFRYKLPEAMAVYYQLQFFILCLKKPVDVRNQQLWSVEIYMQRQVDYLKLHFPDLATGYQEFLERCKSTKIAVDSVFDVPEPQPLTPLRASREQRSEVGEAASSLDLVEPSDADEIEEAMVGSRPSIAESM